MGVEEDNNRETVKIGDKAILLDKAEWRMCFCNIDEVLEVRQIDYDSVRLYSPSKNVADLWVSHGKYQILRSIIRIGGE